MKEPKNTDSYVVILAGGIGSRFWPISKQDTPKQFLDLLNIGETMLQSTYNRYVGLVPKENIYVISNQLYAPIICAQLPELDPNQLILEPLRKSTAASMLFVLFKIAKINPDAQVLVSPADHVILHQTRLEVAFERSMAFVKNYNQILVWAASPTQPETHYTYIQYHPEPVEGDIYAVKTLAEYPSADMAAVFFSSGEFLWNMGIFAANANTWLLAYKNHLPDLYELFVHGTDVYNTVYEQEFIDVTYPRCPQTTIKRGILYNAQNLNVLKCQLGWGKIHNWAALYQHHAKDYVGNAVGGNTVVMYDSSGCVVKVPNNKLVIVQGLEDYIIADSENALIICKRSEESHLKNMTNLIARKNGDKFL